MRKDKDGNKSKQFIHTSLKFRKDKVNEYILKKGYSEKGIPNHPLKILSTKRFGSRTVWVGSIIAWVALNGVEVSLHAEAKNFGLWKVFFV